jgi:hypothetical protein
VNYVTVQDEMSPNQHVRSPHKFNDWKRRARTVLPATTLPGRSSTHAVERPSEQPNGEARVLPMDLRVLLIRVTEQTMHWEV